MATPSEFYSFGAGRSFAFEARFQADTAATADGASFFGIGEMSHATQPLGADNVAILGKAHAGFSTIDGAITFSHAHDTTATTSATLATLVAATDTVLGFEYDGTNQEFKAYIDGSLVLTQALATAPDDLMAIICGIQNGADGNAKTAQLDYVYFRGEM
jgi:hypothetical protein